MTSPSRWLTLACLCLAQTSATTNELSDEHARRLIARAQELETRGVADSARQAYSQAARLVPAVGDWLTLRIAALTPDATARSTLYRSLGTPAAAARAERVEAETRERFGDYAGAATAYRALGSEAWALRAHLYQSPEPAAQRSIRSALLAIVQSRSGTTEAGRAIAVLDSAFAPLGPAEELAVARSAFKSGSASRAATGFTRAARGTLLSDRDIYDHGTALTRVGRYSEAARVLSGISRGPLAADAAYQRARALVRSGRETEATRILSSISRENANDSAAAGALFLLGDLAASDGREADARAHFQRSAQRYPQSTFAPRALFLSGLMALVQGDAQGAAADFDAVFARYPQADDAAAALYWGGRAWQRLGNTAGATERWREAMRRAPRSYYAVLAARRVQQPAPALPDSGGRITADRGAAAAAERGKLLERIGMNDEAGLEFGFINTAADTSTSRLLARAKALRDAGLSNRGILLARRALSSGAPHVVETYRIAYPLDWETSLVKAARAHQLDPALVASLVRQESWFNPLATSPAGAMGLMQIMPSVGRALARSAGIAPWSSARLHEPELNLRLGTAHLATMIRQYKVLPRALAAYNAGGSRVTRWSRLRGTQDHEMFVERIPFTETRDYVRIVERDRELYRGLYEVLRNEGADRQ